MSVATYNYAFVDYDDVRKTIHGSELIDKGGWQGVTTYYRYDSVAHDGEEFVALATNSNVTPSTDPTQWSILVQIDGEEVPGGEGVDLVARALGSAAYALAGSAYAIGTAAYDLASEAYVVGTASYDLASEAYTLAQNGTVLISIETGSRLASDTYLQNQINQVQIVIVGSLGTLIFEESAARILADSAEQGSRIASDISILLTLGTESGTRSEADQYLQNQIYVEYGTRSEADQYLQNQIYVESGSRVASDIAIYLAIGTESGTRSEADQYLQNQIYVEAGTRSDQDAYLLNLILTSSGSTAGSIVDLTSQLAAEQGTRSSADQVLTNSIGAETQTRQQTDIYHQSEIDSLFGILGVGFSGTFALYMAQTLNGFTDTKLTVVNGIVTGLIQSPMAWDSLETYSTGSRSSLDTGSAWNGASIVTNSIPGLVAFETFESLSAGSVYVIPPSAGTGFGGVGYILDSELSFFSGSDSFETYALGSVSAGMLNAGINCNGTATVFTR